MATSPSDRLTGTDTGNVLGLGRPRARRAHDRADRDRPDPRAARARLPRQPLPHDAPLHDRHARPHREGIVGEAYAGDEDAGLVEIEAIIHDEIAPRLVGEDAFAVERCWELARPATFDILRDRRLGLVACACVDAAIWDAVGKALGQPLWRLWGGYRDRAPDDRDRRLLRQPARRRRRGRRAARARARRDEVQGRRPHARGGRRRASGSRARRRAPTSCSLPTPTRAWTPARRSRFARLVEDCDLRWFEEPCRWHNDRRAMRDVRAHGAACRSARGRASSRPAAAAT